MLAFAFLCIALGVWPEPLYALLPHPVTYQPYTAAHVLSQLQLLLFSGLAFFVMLPYLKRTLTITLDTDWVWRSALPTLWRQARRLAGHLGTPLQAWGSRTARAALTALGDHAGHNGRLSATWRTRSMAMWVLVLLLAYLLLYYV
jgi:multicomponent Na+:H+ antiporter subunit D